jgi:hypothetical protein
MRASLASIAAAIEDWEMFISLAACTIEPVRRAASTYRNCLRVKCTTDILGKNGVRAMLNLFFRLTSLRYFFVQRGRES